MKIQIVGESQLRENIYFKNLTQKRNLQISFAQEIIMISCVFFDEKYSKKDSLYTIVNMKKIILYILSFLILSVPSVSALEAQWFTQISENNGAIDFVCEEQCFIPLGTKSINDYIHLQWEVSWEGIIWYGVMNGQQVVPGELMDVKSYWTEYKFFFNRLKYYNELQANHQIVFIIQWQITGSHVQAFGKQFSFWDKVASQWKSFWNMETLTPYSINLRYGVKIFWTSIVWIGYALFFLFFLYSLFNKKMRNINTFLTIWFSIFLFIGFRNLITYWNITTKWLNEYTFAQADEKKFFDLWDYIVFVGKVLEKIEFENCSVYTESQQSWPFDSHMRSVYLRECEITKDKDQANYHVYYKKAFDENLDAQILLEYNNSYLLQINK